MTVPREERVRERARLIWEFQGRPVGHDLEHWLLAEQLVELDEGRLGSSQKLAELATGLAHDTFVPSEGGGKSGG